MTGALAPASCPGKYAHAPVRQNWLARHVEPVLDPGRPIIDTHHHFETEGSATYLLEDLLGDIGRGHKVIATVFVDCLQAYREDGPVESRSLGETEFAAKVARQVPEGSSTRACAAIVGNVDLRLGDRAREVLEAHILAGESRFRGIRNVSRFDPNVPRATSANRRANDPIPGLLADASFRQGFRHLAPLELSFDAWLYHPQLRELADLASAFPDTTIVANHIGGPLGIAPYRREQVFAAWKTGLRSVAANGNVRLKIGGMGMRLFGFDYEARDTPPTSLELANAWRPYVETCIELFGPGRCMFESNFPVDKATCSYTVLWNAFKRITASYSESEKEALYWRTAADCYRMDRSLREGGAP